MTLISEKPKVAATGIGGTVGVLAVWGYNTVFEGSKWILDEPINLAVVAVITFFIGPILRKYEKWANK